MEGTFFITLDYLKQLGACREGQREFQRVFPDGGELIVTRNYLPQRAA